ncbi:hypothetical protein WA026_017150 [Henosepilachna vigintioctopunctata]|uniref:Uncharacterized protein n=1 Tax=Henosepilachna vigintioctopunctata TaxID=420089 RepID=A0AAW1TLQ6_9CUCU
MMKASKYTQASSPVDNEYRDYQNIEVTRISNEERNKNVDNFNRGDIAIGGTHCKNANAVSEHIFKTNYGPFGQAELDRLEGNANTRPSQDIEMVCNCAIKEALLPAKMRFRDSNSEQNLVLNRSFTSIPKLESTNLSQYSLDRRAAKFPGGRRHLYGNEREQSQKFPQRFSDRNVMTLKRIQSPEIINIHRGQHNSMFYDGYDSEHCSIKSCAREKDQGCDEYGFQRHRSFRTPSRSNVNHSSGVGAHSRRPPGDGMVQEMDDLEHMLGLSEQLSDCHCPYDRMLYTPGFTTCLEMRVSIRRVSRSRGDLKVIFRP